MALEWEWIYNEFYIFYLSLSYFKGIRVIV